MFIKVLGRIFVSIINAKYLFIFISNSISKTKDNCSLAFDNEEF